MLEAPVAIFGESLALIPSSILSVSLRMPSSETKGLSQATGLDLIIFCVGIFNFNLLLWDVQGGGQDLSKLLLSTIKVV